MRGMRRDGREEAWEGWEGGGVRGMRGRRHGRDEGHERDEADGWGESDEGDLQGTGPSDAQNIIPVPVRQIAVVTVTGNWFFGCSELHSRACSADRSGDSYRELALRMLRTPFPCLFGRSQW